MKKRTTNNIPAAHSGREDRSSGVPPALPAPVPHPPASRAGASAAPLTERLARAWAARRWTSMSVLSVSGRRRSRPPRSTISTWRHAAKRGPTKRTRVREVRAPRGPRAPATRKASRTLDGLVGELLGDFALDLRHGSRRVGDESLEVQSDVVDEGLVCGGASEERARRREPTLTDGRARPPPGTAREDSEALSRGPRASITPQFTLPAGCDARATRGGGARRAGRRRSQRPGRIPLRRQGAAPRRARTVGGAVDVGVLRARLGVRVRVSLGFGRPHGARAAAAECGAPTVAEVSADRRGRKKRG